MFENKEQIKKELEYLKKRLKLTFSLDDLNKRDLKKIRMILKNEMNSNEIIRKNNYYNSILTKIKNRNKDDIISEFGYTFSLPDENKILYKTLIICIKYKNSDDWINIYEYKKETLIDVTEDNLSNLYNYKNLINSKYITFEERNCIKKLIEKDENAQEIFNKYLNNIIYSDIKKEYDQKNKGKS